MSDKHTAAQRNEVIDRAIRFIESGSHTTIARDTMTNELRKIRATEGQAQTSVADLPKLNNYVLAGDLYSTTRVYKLEDVRAAILADRAAQLADSTAPGAPVDALRLAVTAVLREALDAVAVHPCDVSDDTVRAKGLYGVMADLHAALSAAPTDAKRETAQQSLTAGGAVPTWERRYKEITGTELPPKIAAAYKAGTIGMGIETAMAEEIAAYRKLFAAAPLPRVQSEALDKAVRSLEGYAASYDMMSRIGDGKVDCVSVKHDISRNMVDAVKRAFADQQPVTPSGALADN